MTDSEFRRTTFAVILGIAVGGILCSVASPPLTAVQCGWLGPGSGSSGAIPIGAAGLAIGTPSETTLGSNHWYNFSVQSAGGGLHLYDLKLQVLGPTGSPVFVGGDWRLDVLNAAGSRLGVYSIASPNTGPWSSGGQVLLSTSEIFGLLATPANLSGDNLLVSGNGAGVCPFQGSTSVSIP